MGRYRAALFLAVTNSGADDKIGSVLNVKNDIILRIPRVIQLESGFSIPCLLRALFTKQRRFRAFDALLWKSRRILRLQPLVYIAQLLHAFCAPSKPPLFLNLNSITCICNRYFGQTDLSWHSGDRPKVYSPP